MMDLQTIREQSLRKAAEASLYKKEPLLFEESDGHVPFLWLKRIPSLGDYLAPGWNRHLLSSGHGIVDEDNSGCGAYFVDSSNWGRDGEPALTVEQFVRQLKPGLGYAIIETGQFQVKIGVFEKIR